MINTRKVKRQSDDVNNLNMPSTLMIQDVLQTKEQEVLSQIEKMGFRVEKQNILIGVSNIVAYRHEEIQRIEADVLVVLEMSKELDQKVNEQQEKVEHTDTNLKSAEKHTSNAQVELEKEKKSRCIIL